MQENAVFVFAKNKKFTVKSNSPSDRQRVSFDYTISEPTQEPWNGLKKFQEPARFDKARFNFRLYKNA